MAEPISNQLPISEHYLKDVHRIANAALSRRSKTLGEPGAGNFMLTMQDINDQLILRAGVIRDNSWRREKAALVAFLKVAADVGKRPALVTQMRAYFDRRSKAGARAGRSKFGNSENNQQNRTGELAVSATSSNMLAVETVMLSLADGPISYPSKFIDIITQVTLSTAKARASSAVALQANLSDDGSGRFSEELEHAHREAAGVAGQPLGARRPFSGFTQIPYEDLRAIRSSLVGAALPAHIFGQPIFNRSTVDDSEWRNQEIGKTFSNPASRQALLSRATDAMGSVELYLGDLANHYGLAAGLVFEATWFTGLRPTEWFATSIVSEVTDAAGDRSIKDLQQELTPTLERVSFGDRLHGYDRRLVKSILLHAAMEALLDIDAAKEKENNQQTRLLMVVRNAKTREALIKGLPEKRILDITSLPLEIKKGIFILSTFTNWAQESSASTPENTGERSDADKDNLWRTLRRHLAHASEAIPGGSRRISFYDARHDFADRGRSLYTRAELMALMGHAGARSIENYGRKGRRQGSSGRGGAMAKPDPELVTVIVEALAVHGLSNPGPSEDLAASRRPEKFLEDSQPL